MKSQISKSARRRQPLTLRATALAIALIASQTFAADQLEVGPLRINFPNTNWSQTAPPAELQRGYDKAPPNVKLVFHAISPAARLRFHIVKVDFSSLEATNLPIAFAGLLDGTKRRCQRQATGEVHETKGLVGETPFTGFESDVEGDLFLNIRSLLCKDSAYLLEINGPRASKSEAEKVIANVFVGESEPLSSQAVGAVSEVRESPPVSTQRRAYELGRRIGYISGIVVVLAAVLIVVVTIISSASRRRKSSDGAAKPPPIPPAVSG